MILFSESIVSDMSDSNIKIYCNVFTYSTARCFEFPCDFVYDYLLILCKTYLNFKFIILKKGVKNW